MSQQQQHVPAPMMRLADLPDWAVSLVLQRVETAGPCISLHGCLPYPVWIADCGPGGPYYRADVPAALTGGKSTDSLSVALPGRGTPSSERADDVLALLPRIREISLVYTGSPMIFCPAHLNTERLSGLMRSIIAAGGDAWMESDDDILSLPLATYRQIILDRDPGAVNAPDGTPQPEVAWRTAQATAQLYYARVAAAASGIIVSTPRLAEVLRPYNAQIRVLPNLINPDHFVRVQRPADGTVRLGYGGTVSHNGADLAVAWPALAACARLPRVELHFWGLHPRSSESQEAGPYEHEGVRYHYHAGLPFFAYHQAIGMLDVAVAPLADIPFNEAKSPCKWLEHSLHETPMVLSDLEPYRCVQDGVTGLKARSADEFAVQLRRLVEDGELRTRIGQAARAEVLRRHTPQAQGPAIRALFAELRQSSPPNLLAGLDIFAASRHDAADARAVAGMVTPARADTS